MIDFLFLGSRITVDGACSHEVGRYLLLGRKAMKTRQCAEKQRLILFCGQRSVQSRLWSSQWSRMAVRAGL